MHKPTLKPYTLMSRTIQPSIQNSSKSMSLPTHSRTEKHENLTKPIRNAGFVVTRRSRALSKIRQNFNLAFEMKKVNTKYKVLAMWLTESSAFQKPHNA